MSQSNIKDWSPTAASNNDSSNGGMPEGQAPSTVNDNMRVQMAAHRVQWEDAEWFNWGHTVAFASATEFTATIDETYSDSGTNIYSVGRRLKCYNGSSILYGDVVSVSAAAANQYKVTVSLSSGALTSSISSVAVSIFNPTPSSIPLTTIGLAPSTQAQMEAAASNDSYATPANLKYHPGVAKSWVRFSISAGAQVITTQYPSGHSIDDLGTGSFRLNYPFSLSTSTVCILINANDSVGLASNPTHHVTSIGPVSATIVTKNGNTAADYGTVIITYGVLQ